MKINARLIVGGIRNNVQGKAHYWILIQRIISGGILRQLISVAKRFCLYTGGGISGYFRSRPDESYRILPPLQNPQNPALNPHSRKTAAKREAVVLGKNWTKISLICPFCPVFWLEIR